MARLPMPLTLFCAFALSQCCAGQTSNSPSAAATAATPTNANGSGTSSAIAPTTVSTPVAVATTAKPDAAGRYMLHEGDDVPLKFAQDISSKTAAEGDPVMFVLANDLTVGNVVVAKAGCKAYGEVTNAKKSGMMGKGGELSIRLDHLKVGDSKVRLRGTKGKEGKDATGSTVALTVLFGPIGLIKHGHNIDIKDGTALLAYVADDVALPPVAASTQ
jgi:hypothetical protein